MGAVLSFIVWFFSDPIARGRPQVYLPPEPEYLLVRAGASPSWHPSKEEKGKANETGTRSLSLREFVESRCPALQQRYKPTWWLPNGHFQTIWASIGNFNEVDEVIYERTTIEVPDGGIMGLDFTSPAGETLPPETPIVVALHGLTGGSHESYVRSILAPACDSKSRGGLGFRGVVMNFRGCAGVPLRTPQMFSGGHTGDIRCALLYISHLYPNAPLLGIGFSLGACVLTKYVGESGDDCRLTSASVLACPWDNVKNSDKLEHRLINYLIYSKAMGGTLQGLFKRNYETIKTFPRSDISHHFDALATLKNPDFKTVNSHLTSIVGGFSPPFPFPTVDDYYAWASCHHDVGGIRVPFLSFNSLDDPIVAEVPLREAGKNGWVGMCVTREGGHLGWFQNGPFLQWGGGPPPRWIRKPVLQWLRATGEDLVMGPRKGKARTEKSDGWVIEAGDDRVGFKVVEVGAKVASLKSLGL